MNYDTNKVRKQWLISLITVYVSYWAIELLGFTKRVFPKDFSPQFFLFVVAPLVLFLVASVTYYFAYKKRGTKWLLLQLIIVPFNLIANIISIATWGSRLSNDLWIAIITFPLVTYYIFNSYKLYQVNAAYHQQKK